MKVMITGAAGFVGAALVEKYLKEGHKVIACVRTNWDRLVPLKDEYGNKLFVYHQAHIGDAWAWPTDLFEDVETVIHLAWCGTSGELRTDYGAQLLMAQETATFMELCYKRGVSRFVGVGTIMEYEVEYAVHDNNAHPQMGYCYALGKTMAHGLCKCIANDPKWKSRSFVWPMITNAYGPGEESPRLVNTTIKKIINNEKLEFSAATQNYDFVYITDVANAIYLAATKGKNNAEYMIGSGAPGPLKDYLNEIITTCGGAKATFGAIPPGTSLPYTIFSPSDLYKDTGWEAEVKFDEGIKLTFDWWKEKLNDTEV